MTLQHSVPIAQELTTLQPTGANRCGISSRQTLRVNPAFGVVDHAQFSKLEISKPNNYYEIL